MTKFTKRFAVKWGTTHGRLPTQYIMFVVECPNLMINAQKIQCGGPSLSFLRLFWPATGQIYKERSFDAEKPGWIGFT
jgi:hypothetical protein